MSQCHSNRADRVGTSACRVRSRPPWLPVRVAPSNSLGSKRVSCPFPPLHCTSCCSCHLPAIVAATLPEKWLQSSPAGHLGLPRIVCEFLHTCHRVSPGSASHCLGLINVLVWVPGSRLMLGPAPEISWVFGKPLPFFLGHGTWLSAQRLLLHLVERSQPIGRLCSAGVPLS